jgi:hypothetical protein
VRYSPSFLQHKHDFTWAEVRTARSEDFLTFGKENLGRSYTWPKHFVSRCHCYHMVTAPLKSFPLSPLMSLIVDHFIPLRLTLRKQLGKLKLTLRSYQAVAWLTTTARVRVTIDSRHD